MARLRLQAVDPRIIVLLIIGAFIIIQYVPHPADHIIDDSATFFSVKKTDNSVTFYYCLKDGGSWSAIYKLAGLKPPVIENTPWPPASFSSYKIVSANSPVPVDIPPEISPFAFLPIPINTASSETLMMIPGIGKGLADKIIHYRLQYGTFTRISDLEKIRGIGSVKSRNLSEYISL